MSLSGQLLRGLGWYNFRSAHSQKEFGTFGNLFLPEDILGDPHKMEELKFYMEFVKVREEKEVHKVQILDPACGTGTFLSEVVKQIYKRFEGTI